MKNENVQMNEMICEQNGLGQNLCTAAAETVATTPNDKYEWRTKKKKRERERES